MHKPLENVSMEDLEKQIRKRWQQFRDNELPKIENILDEQSWIWEVES